MKVFFLDLWQDLKAKRLLPVAIVLAVAVVAVPVLLLKSTDKPSDSSATVVSSSARPGGPDPTTGGVVTADQQSEAGSSNLSVFGEKDPFQPTGSAAKSSPSGGSTSGSSGAPAGSAAGDATGAVSASTFGGSGSTGSGGSTSTGTSGGSTGSTDTSGGSGDTSQPKTETKTTFYTYTADVNFGRRGSPKRYNDLQRLEMLPNKRRPLLVFMGVTATGNTAVFLVDSSLSQSGEGFCEPSVERCTFLYLRTDNARDEHSFTDADGREYTVKLLGIQRMREKDALKAASARAHKQPKKSHRHGKSHGFALPRLVDLFG